MTDHDLDLLLADLNADVPAMTDEAFEAGRARLPGVKDAGTVATPTPVASVTELPRRRPVRSPPRRIAQLAAAVAAAAVVATGVVLVQDSGPVTPVSVTTPEQLAAWAQGLADDPSPVQPGQFGYQKTALRDTGDMRMVPSPAPNFRSRTERDWEVWQPYDYRDEWMKKTGLSTTTWLEGPDAAPTVSDYFVPLEQPGLTQTGKCDSYFPVEEPSPDLEEMPGFTVEPCDGDGWRHAGSPEFYEELTGDPGRLYDSLRERVGNDPVWRSKMFDEAGRLLDANLSGGFKSTLFQAMSRVPGLVVLDNQRTEDGRTGIGIRVADGTNSDTWILDRDTGDVLQQNQDTKDSQTVLTHWYGVADSLGGAPH